MQVSLSKTIQLLFNNLITSKILLTVLEVPFCIQITINKLEIIKKDLKFGELFAEQNSGKGG